MPGRPWTGRVDREARHDGRAPGDIQAICGPRQQDPRGAGHRTDWEGWGQGPRGYDHATLLAYSLLQPDIANRVRECFPELGSPATWAGEAAAVAELLQTVARGDNEELAKPLKAWVEQLRKGARSGSPLHQAYKPLRRHEPARAPYTTRPGCGTAGAR